MPTVFYLVIIGRAAPAADGALGENDSVSHVFRPTAKNMPITAAERISNTRGRKSRRAIGSLFATSTVWRNAQKPQDLSSSIGLVLGSQKNLNCVFRGQPGEPEEGYTGTMTTISVDIGFTIGGVIVWSVFADTNRYAGMLTGKYGGATAEVFVAAGLGANVLVGGSN